jgi:diaminohydroxyphosphoribosylaminopyrimidine deaminase/5-amino-6-(5-phosphoribosylamino)uracil reductase
MKNFTEGLLSSAFGFALFDSWPDLADELTSTDDRLLYRALELASHGVGRTHPNPPVGSVVSKAGTIIAEGFHERAGLPHAEAKALKLAGENAKGADVYITLEPCAHYGRTPPCNLAVIASGVKKARIGTLDPNPKVDGGGLSALLDAGIDAKVTENPFLHSLALNMMAPFANTMNKKRPYVVLHIASSLDGRVAAKPGEETAITSKASLKISHRLRDKVDAVVVGRSTVEIDDPKLTVREVSRRDERQPLRIVFDSQVALSTDHQVFAQGNCLVVHDQAVALEKLKALDAVGAKHVGVYQTAQGLSLPEAMTRLYEHGLTSLLVEGGPHLWTSFLNAGLVDEIWWYDAPMILGASGIEALGTLTPQASDWLSVGKHESHTVLIDRDQLTIMRIQKPH